MGQTETKDIDVKELWKKESKLSLQDRRARYKCKNKFITADQIPTWDKDVQKAVDNSVARSTQEARTAAKNERKEKQRQERKAKKAEAKEQSNNNNNTVVMEETKTEEQDPYVSRQKVSDDERKRREAEEDQKQKEEERTPIGKFSPDAELNKKIAMIQADITTLELDAIVNAANQSCLGGGGIDGAIHRAAGPMLYQECTTLNGCKPGFTKITRGHNLPAQMILHTVGPIGRDEKTLISSYETCLELVVKYNIRTIAFCGVSTGIYGYPLYAASHIAINTIRNWLDKGDNRTKVDLIVFCTFLPKETFCYEKLLPWYFPPPGKTTDDILALYKNAFDSYDPSNELADIDKEIEKEEKERKEKKKVLQEERVKREKELKERLEKMRLADKSEKEQQKPQEPQVSQTSQQKESEEQTKQSEQPKEQKQEPEQQEQQKPEEKHEDQKQDQQQEDPK